ncbi:MAG TPA: transaldolase family protein [Acidimicrobiales bacterium]|nr:transaldolase family protein [Acidimicrobiales bacterium]
MSSTSAAAVAAPRTTGRRSPLQEMTQATPTSLWNDSASTAELTYSIQNGAVGATCNPVIALSVVRQEISKWGPRLSQLVEENPTATEDQLGWMLVEEVSRSAASLLQPVFQAEKGRNGRLSIQTDPRYYRDTKAILRQAERFSALADNMIVKVPATSAGIPAIEEATYAGISINATVSFTLAQAVQVAEAVERGLRRREAEGKDTLHMGPVCTIMVGRLDDWLKIVAEKQGILTDPGHFEWAGVAVFKKAYQIYNERGYRTRLLSAAFRNHFHWSELVGGDVVISPPYAWQVRINASDIAVQERIDRPVSEEVVADLLRRFPDFRRAYEPDGLAVEEFDAYPATRRTLRQFMGACSELAALVRDTMVPNPDVG